MDLLERMNDLGKQGLLKSIEKAKKESRNDFVKGAQEVLDKEEYLCGLNLFVGLPGLDHFHDFFAGGCGEVVKCAKKSQQYHDSCLIMAMTCVSEDYGIDEQKLDEFILDLKQNILNTPKTRPIDLPELVIYKREDKIKANGSNLNKFTLYLEDDDIIRPKVYLMFKRSDQNENYFIFDGNMHNVFRSNCETVKGMNIDVELLNKYFIKIPDAKNRCSSLKKET